MELSLEIKNKLWELHYARFGHSLLGALERDSIERHWAMIGEVFKAEYEDEIDSLRNQLEEI